MIKTYPFLTAITLCLTLSSTHAHSCFFDFSQETVVNTETAPNVVVPIKTNIYPDNIQIHVYDSAKVRAYEAKLRELVPSENISFEPKLFSAAVNKNKKIVLVAEKELRSKMKSDALFYTWNVRECCVIALRNSAMPLSGIMAHLYPCNKEATIATLNNLLGRIKELKNIDYHDGHLEAQVIGAFLSDHLLSICKALKDLNIPIKAIYTQPVVGEITRDKKPIYTCSYCPDRFFMKGEEMHCRSAITGETYKRPFPQRVTFDTATGEVATGLKLKGVA